jgi:predicted  nucleic acid-binding Zn-ribbon protein
MQENIRLLIELQEADSTIIRKKAVINSLPSNLSSAEKIFKEIQSLYEKEKQRCELLEKKKKDKERGIEDINEKIKKTKAHALNIKTNKEYQAHLKEIETIEKERYAIEDEILSFMEAIEAAAKEVKAAELKMKAEKDKVEAFRKEVEEEIAEAEKELGEFKVRRIAIADKIDPDVYSNYMALLEKCNGLAVVEASDEICQGCNMNIPPQMFVELKKNIEIIQCQQCDRILYWKEKSE